ncbi:hypothetical protein KX729_17285 [Rhizobium sp. XQZ8]|uniref:hypothetical protein n=1 Tax=Rhizobium populisoli TaxID=2859785 RepID=UPI001CA51341|nr:hypothetical protein [Rhizobium populisoli]MBW6423214.1 hypothetical protein [Rhizobium populisoli]
MERLLFRNMRPFYGWLLIFAWFAVLAFSTLISIREGLAVHPFRALIILFFWGLGGWLAIHAFNRPIVSVWQRDPHDWLVKRRWLWTYDEQHVDPDRLAAPIIEEGDDGEGGRQYRCLLSMPGGAVSFSEHVKQEKAALSRDRMAFLIRRARTEAPRSTIRPAG